MQIILLILVYLLAAVVNYYPLKKVKSNQKPINTNWWGLSLKQAFLAFLAGTLGVMALDFTSQGEPAWPAAALAACVAGELFPAWKTVIARRTGVLSFCGGIFYIDPAMAAICLGIALEVLWLGKDCLLTILVFTGLVPVLIWYAQMSPVFFGVSVAIELLIIWRFRAELWERIKPGN